MDAFRQWILCIIFAAAAGTFACAVSPRGSTDKTVRAVVGIFVVSAICAPLSSFDFEEIILPAFADSYNAETENEEIDDYIIYACKSAVESEIMQSASDFGIAVESIAADVGIDDDKCIIIHDIQIKIQTNKAGSKSDFLKSIEEKLGVTVTLTAD